MARRRIRPGLIAVGLVLSLAGLALTGPSVSAAKNSKPVKGGTLTFIQQVDPRSLDPITMSTASQAAGTGMFFNAFGALVYLDTATQTIKPLLAESLESPDDGLTWILKLLPNLKFSDNTPLNAEAVKFNWDRITNPANASLGAATFSSVASYTVTDPLTITLTLKTKNSFFGNTIATSAMSYIGSPAAIQQLGADFGSKPVGAGPFLLKEWIRADHSTWTPNPTFVNAKKVNLDEVIVRPITESVPKQTAFSTGVANLVWTGQLPDVEAMEAADGKTTKFPLVGGISLVYNMAKAPFTDPTVRTAFAQAMDRGMIAANVWKEPTPLQKGLLPESSAVLDPKALYAKKDLPAAQKAIDAYTAKNGAITISLLHTTGSQFILDSATILKQQLEGVTVNLDGIDQAALIARWRGGDWTMTFSGLSTGVTPDPVLYNAFRTGGSFNFWNYSNPSVDAALDHSRLTTDPKEQKADFGTVQKEVTKDGFFPPINAINYFLVGAKNVNVFGYGDGVPRTDLIWIGKGAKS